MSLRHNNNGGSSTAVVELSEVVIPQSPIRTSEKISRPSSIRTTDGKILGTTQEPDDIHGSLPSPITATEKLQSWNDSRTNIYRIAATFWSFMIMGMNDSAYGALIPYLETYYNLSYTVVSLIFLSPLVGYTLSALLNNTIHMRVGQRGVAFISPGCHLLSYVVIAVHPPYPVLVVIFMIAGFGNGLADAAWNAWIGNMAKANELLGLLHGFYGLGAVLSPLIATSMITKGHFPWYRFYYVMIAAATAELATSVTTFWKATGKEHRETHKRTSDKQESHLKEALFRAPNARTTWLCAVFLLGYVGIEVALGGWIVTFMLQVRHGEAFASGMTATGFWLGLTVGRVVLGFITPKIGEKRAIAIYLPLTMGFELLFWLVPQFYVSAVAVALQGFFLGPLFPAAIVAATKLLPKHLHVTAIGFAAAFGGSGAAIFPFAVGAIAQAKGVQVLQPIILALLATIFVLWLGLPRMSRKSE